MAIRSLYFSFSASRVERVAYWDVREDWPTAPEEVDGMSECDVVPQAESRLIVRAPRTIEK